ncbi:MAG: hypothetical protein JF595_17610 [Sphingomonadales bacterium]|nr:hypothetical protein [Sphingomonadales bacterium]
MVTDWEIWACAYHVLRSHGGEADAFVAARITRLAEVGDADGVATWRAIAARMDRLRAAPADTVSLH